jgi:hypothetical protein
MMVASWQEEVQTQVPDFCFYAFSNKRAILHACTQVLMHISRKKACITPDIRPLSGGAEPLSLPIIGPKCCSKVCTS